MPWNWTAPSSARGTPAEAAQPGAWPQYQNEVLLKTLQQREKAATGLSEAAKGTYLDKASRNFEEEADEALHAEFQDWLQGKHDANVNNDLYLNNVDGAPVRRHIYGPKAGQPYDGWHHTPWRDRQLTHLSGVRDHLRAQAAAKNEHELQMNFLAEHGPSNLQEAWMYFKHWVKQRPLKLGPQRGLGESAYDLGERSRGFNLPPDEAGYQQQPSWRNTDGPLTGPRIPPAKPYPPPPEDDDDDSDRPSVDYGEDEKDEELPSPQSDGEEEARIAEEVKDVAESFVERVVAAANIAEEAAEEATGAAASAAVENLNEAGLPEAAEFVDAEEAEIAAREELRRQLADFSAKYLDIPSGLISRNFEHIADWRIHHRVHRDDFVQHYDSLVKQMMKEASEFAKKNGMDERQQQEAILKHLDNVLVLKAKDGAFGADPAAQREWVRMLKAAAEQIAKGKKTTKSTYHVTKAMNVPRRSARHR